MNWFRTSGLFYLTDRTGGFICLQIIRTFLIKLSPESKGIQAKELIQGKYQFVIIASDNKYHRLSNLQYPRQKRPGGVRCTMF